MTDLNTPYSTRLCLSGLESRRLLETFAEMGVKHIQVSYYYLRRVFQDPQDFEHFVAPFTTVIIDSGTVYHKFKSESEEKSFLGEYAAYIGGLNKRSFTAAVYEGGVDMDNLLPEEMLIYPLEEIRSVFDDDLKAVCQNIQWVGVGNKEASYKGGENIERLVTEARKQGTWIHLFGTSKKSILQKFPIYSAYARSCRTGSRYQNTYIFEGGSRGLRLYQPSDKSDSIKTEKENTQIRRRQENMIKVRQPNIHGLIDWGAVYEGDAWEVDKGNLSQWLLYQDYLDSTPHKAYWLDSEEKQAVLARKINLPGNFDNPPDIEKGKHSSSTPIDKGGDIQGGNIEEDTTDNTGNNTPPVYNADIEDPNNPRIIESDSIENPIEKIEGVVEDSIVGGREDIPGNEILEIGGDPSTASTPHVPAVFSVDKGGVPRIRPVDDRQRQVRQCDFCILAGRCPKYAPGSPCSFGLPPENPTYDHNQLERHVMEDAADLLAIQMDRIQQAVLEEKMDASGLNKDVTNNLKIYMEMVQLLSEATDKRDTLEVKAKGKGIVDLFTNRKKA